MRTGVKIKTARRLRKIMTKPEIWLWVRIRKRTETDVYFRRQHPVGPYVLDFYCLKAKLCVEVDGEIHTHAIKRQNDAERDRFLSEKGILTHRVIAKDLLENPDEIATGIIDLARSRITE